MAVSVYPCVRDGLPKCPCGGRERGGVEFRFMKPCILHTTECRGTPFLPLGNFDAPSKRMYQRQSSFRYSAHKDAGRGGGMIRQTLASFSHQINHPFHRFVRRCTPFPKRLFWSCNFTFYTQIHLIHLVNRLRELHRSFHEHKFFPIGEGRRVPRLRSATVECSIFQRDVVLLWRIQKISAENPHCRRDFQPSPPQKQYGAITGLGRNIAFEVNKIFNVGKHSRRICALSFVCPRVSKDHGIGRPVKSLHWKKKYIFLQRFQTTKLQIKPLIQSHCKLFQYHRRLRMYILKKKSLKQIFPTFIGVIWFFKSIYRSF